MWRTPVACLFVVMVFGGIAYLVAPKSVTIETPPAGNPFDIEEYKTNAAGQPICPKCGRSDEIGEYLYGLVREGIPPGRISGGCVMSSDSARYKCLHCETRFGRFDLHAPK